MVKLSVSKTELGSSNLSCPANSRTKSQIIASYIIDGGVKLFWLIILIIMLALGSL